MARFFRNVLSTVVGIFISFFFLFIILLIIIISSTSSPEPFVRDNTILNITFKGTINDISTSNPFDEIITGESKALSLAMLSDNLAKAAKDKRISGLLLEMKDLDCSWANLSETRKALTKFKESGKFIVAYTDDAGYSEKTYYLASAADFVAAPPETFFEFDGFYAQGEFYKNLFDKVGVKPEITRYGKYKSAIEPYIRSNFSNESREQLSVLLQTNLNEFVNTISESREISVAKLNAFLNEPPNLSSAKAFERGLLDSLIYPDEMETYLKQKAEVKEASKLRKISLSSYNKVTLDTSTKKSKDKIAIIYADGMIVPDAPYGFDDNSYLTFKKIDEAFDKALADKNTKAIVLRINSPGGSGNTADLMWNKIKKASEKLPVFASMGGVAASGGYYIAVATDTIFAEATTITGSIGVFSTKFNVQTLVEDKIGVTFDVVKTHQHADWMNPFRSFTKSEDSAFQGLVNGFYDTFLNRVDDGRSLLNKDEIHALAQGRVWSGADAKYNGLVDEIGGLEDAITYAAKRAGLESYQTVSYPKAQSLVEQILKSTNEMAVSVLGFEKTGIGKVYFEIMDQLNADRRKPALHALLPIDIQIQ